MVNSQEKGKGGERELAKSLGRILDTQKTRRGRQYNGLEGKDVVGWEGVHIECKRTERFNLYAALDQAIDDAAAGEVPIVCHRRNLKEWVVVVRLNDLPELAKRVNDVLGIQR